MSNQSYARNPLSGSQQLQRPTVENKNPASSAQRKSKRQTKTFHGPLLQCRDAIENCDPESLRRILLTEKNAAIIGELFAPSSCSISVIGSLK
jgi:hypothetical protein